MEHEREDEGESQEGANAEGNLLEEWREKERYPIVGTTVRKMVSIQKVIDRAGQLAMGYNEGTHRNKRREIIPRGFFLKEGSRWIYLEGECLLTNEVKTFKVEKISLIPEYPAKPPHA